MSSNFIGFTAEGKVKGDREKLMEAFQRVIKYQSVEPELSLIQAEKVLETICKKLFIREIGPETTNLAISDLIDLLIRHKVFPKAIAIHLRTIDIWCSDIYDGDNEIESFIEPCIESLKIVLAWYLGEETAEDLVVSNKKFNKSRTNSPVYNNNFSKEKGKLGTGSFAHISELSSISGDDGLIIGKQLRLSHKKSLEHCVCVGPTGSGKTASFFIPNLLSLPNASMVVSDPKGELFQKTAAENIAQGKNVVVFNPYAENTMKYNPLSLCRDVYEVRELAQVLLANGNASVEAMTGSKAGGSEWINMSIPLLTAFLLFVKDLSPPKNTVAYALQLITENDIETLKFLIMDYKDSGNTNIWEQASYKQFNIFLQSSESERTAASIKTVLAANLQLFAEPTIENATSENEINPMELRKRPTVLYVNIPEHKSAVLAPLMAPFYTQLMEHLIEGDTSLPVYFMLDEFANIGIIPNIDRALATFRSRNISISLAIQSINQLRQIYGEEKTHSILDNLKTKFVLPGLAFDSANYFSKLCGYKEIVTISKSYGNGREKSISFNSTPQKRELVTPGEIRRLEDQTMISIVDNLNPFKDFQYRYYEDDEMLEKTKNEMILNGFLNNKCFYK